MGKAKSTPQSRRQGARLEAARLAADYRSARAAALANEWPESSYRSHENGTRTIGQDDAERYAKRFQSLGVSITAKEILFDPANEGPPETPPPARITLVPNPSWVSASAMADVGDIPEGSDIIKIAIADLPDGDWLALTVKGDSMDKIAPDGAIIVINRRERRLLPGRYYVVADRGEATFKKFVDKPAKMLLPHSTNSVHLPIIPGKNCVVIGRVRRVMLDL